MILHTMIITISCTGDCVTIVYSYTHRIVKIVALLRYRDSVTVVVAYVVVMLRYDFAEQLLFSDTDCYVTLASPLYARYMRAAQ